MEIYEYQPTMLHAKTMVVDGAWSIIGSANFDNRSLDMNDEVNIGIADPSVRAALSGDIRRRFAPLESTQFGSVAQTCAP